MKFLQIERGDQQFSAASRGDKKFNRVFHPVSTTPPRELKNDNSLNMAVLNNGKIHRKGYLRVALQLGMRSLNFLRKQHKQHLQMH